MEGKGEAGREGFPKRPEEGRATKVFTLAAGDAPPPLGWALGSGLWQGSSTYLPTLPARLARLWRLRCAGPTPNWGNAAPHRALLWAFEALEVHLHGSASVPGPVQVSAPPTPHVTHCGTTRSPRRVFVTSLLPGATWHQRYRLPLALGAYPFFEPQHTPHCTQAPAACTRRHKVLLNLITGQCNV